MGKISRTFFAGVVMLMGIISSGHAEKVEIFNRRDRLFDSGWKFIRDSVQGAEKPDYDDSRWMTVDLPHDFSIMNIPGEDSQNKTGFFSKQSPGNGNSTGHVIGGTGWYRKSFTLDKADEGKSVIINFDGVYMESEVWVNGRKAGIHKNGYTPFWFDITSLLNIEGKTNVIAVKVDNTGRNSRWYSGSGIYRNVHLILTQPIHVAEWGVYVTTPVINQNSASTDVAVTIRNESEKEANAAVTINIKDKNGRLAGTSKYSIVLSGKSENITKKQIEVKNPLLWSVENPNLYKAEILVEVDNKLQDTYNQTFGIRSIEFSAEKGFLLNGKATKLKGGCLHHDNGFLGSAAIDRAEVRKVELMKANGFNAIRCAHNPPSETFLNACDKLGILVIDEFTDMWESYKNPQDYSRFFRDWWNKDLTDMMLRDRNHPAIIMWSIGNEIPESSTPVGVQTGKQLAERVKALDNTRVVTEAISEIFTPGGWGNTINAIEILDVAGYNYTWTKYDSDHEKYPTRIMYASESFPGDAYDSWKPAEKFPYVIGDFVWSAIDYIGEASIGSASIVPEAKKSTFKMPSELKLPAGMNIFDIMGKMPSVWPYFISGCGDIDITGEKKPQMFYRDVLWDNSKIEISVHEPIPAGFAENLSGWGWPNEQQSWSWKGNEDKPMQVRVFTKASHVKLELNGTIIGEKDLTDEDKYIAVFDVQYQSGELKATGFVNGKEIASKSLKTTEEAFSVRLIADRSKINADRNDLCFVKVEIIDKNGQLVKNASKQIKLTVTGTGELVASGNADPGDMLSVNRPVIKSYRGRGLVVIRPFISSGFINLKAESEGLMAGEISLTTFAQVISKAKPIDRHALVSRHNIVWNDCKGQIPLGNGEFCFNVDGTGLQTFGGNTMSHWGWHSFPLPEGVTTDQIPITGSFQKGHPTGPEIFPKEAAKITAWMTDNPHLLNLGRIRFVKSDGSELKTEEIRVNSRNLDLWSGMHTTDFTIDGQPVKVITCVNPETDLVSVRIVSSLLSYGSVKIAVDFPYPSTKRGRPWVGDFENNTGNRIIVLPTKSSARRLDFRHEIDNSEYYTTLCWSAGTVLKPSSGDGSQSWYLETNGVSTLEFTCAFSPVCAGSVIPDFKTTSRACEAHWQKFWKSGGAIDLSESRDPRWKELERRIVLSQYLMAVQSAGSFPPSEAGLMDIDPWKGQFHMEMIWWHLAHYSLWDRWEMADKALECYKKFTPIARTLAEQLGYKGLKWGKQVGPEGRTAPWSGNEVLLWKQPHPIFFAELDYRLHPNHSILEKWAAIVNGTADQMADYAVRDNQTGIYHLDPVMPPSEQGITKDDIFDLSYWRWGLSQAQVWRERMGLKRNQHWEEVRLHLASLTIVNGVYLHSPEWTDTYTKRNWEHPNLIGIYGMLPASDFVDRETAHRTLLKVWSTWNWSRCWGWDFPWMAMSAARLGEPKLAIDALLKEAGTKNFYDERGVCTGGPCPYLPGNGGLLYAVAMMAAGWDGAPARNAPGFPDDGSWTVRWEGLKPAL